MEQKTKTATPYDLYFLFFKDLHGIQEKCINKIV